MVLLISAFEPWEKIEERKNKELEKQEVQASSKLTLKENIEAIRGEIEYVKGLFSEGVFLGGGLSVSYWLFLEDS